MLAASYDTLRRLVDEAAALALTRPPPHFDERLAAAERWLAGADRHAIALGDPRYPEPLLQGADPPLLLYVQGSVAWLHAPSVAVVGSRRATPQGLDHARRFARALAEAGITVVSGLAIGIDGAAHEGALAAEGDGAGSTLAVTGTGPDIVYPKRHHALAHAIAARGALVTEFAPGTPSIPAHFPLRNRIIAALSRGTLVVEAALQSGSLITARLASEAGREVWAIPGSIHAEQSRGCHALIRQGAALVESPLEIIDQLKAAGQLAARPAGPPAERPAGRPAAGTAAAGAALPSGSSPTATAGRDDTLLQALGTDPVTLDVLLARTGEAVDRLSARLLELELEGGVQRLPGGLFQRVFSG